MPDLIELTHIEAAHALLRPHIRRTPIAEVSGADFGLPPFPLTLKLELLQHSGSFMARRRFRHLLTRALPPSGW